MRDQLTFCFDKLPAYLGGHMLLSVTALAVGLTISLPLGILASRHRKLGETALAMAGVVQTVPSLALLALMVPILNGTIGFLPAFLALTLYSLLPILANTVIGIRGVDPAMIEAARGLGMSDRQMLLRIQLPLAAPVIIGGIRTATVLVVGTATLVTQVGGTSLGNYIFQGFETGIHSWVVFGCVLAALLAIILDQLIRLLEVAARQRRRVLAWTAVAGLLLVTGAGLAAPVAGLFTRHPDPVAVGSLEFTEQHILSDVMAGQLQSAGFAVEKRQGLAENIQFDALCDNEIDCCVEYSGNIWARVMKRTEFLDREATLKETTSYLAERHGVVCLGPLGFENAYALAVPEATAQRLNLRTIGDLRPHAPGWEVVGDNQIFLRLEWRQIRSTYGLTFAKELNMAPTLMYDVAGKGRLQVVCVYTSDGRIQEKNLRILEDPRRVFPPYDAVLLLSPRAAARPGLKEALEPLIGAIDLATMQRANLRVDVEEHSPAKAAEELLATLRQKK